MPIPHPLTRSGAAAFALGALVVVALGASAQDQTPGAQPAGGELGRYQIVFSPHQPADAYLLDNATGRVWVSMQRTDVEGDPRIWMFNDRIDSSADLEAWSRVHPLKPVAAPDLTIR